jgi:hypothetical protein
MAKIETTKKEAYIRFVPQAGHIRYMLPVLYDYLV